MSVNEPESWDLVADSYARVVAHQLEPIAADALRLAEVTGDDRVLDVATGPGTLALLAGKVTRVVATDFSAGMVEQVRARADAAGLATVEAQVADGQALPFEDGAFDAAFSMFGLFIFPERARGFAELFRVLRPGGRAVVSSWSTPPPDHAFTIANGLFAEHATDAPGGGDGPPLATAEALEEEMSEAGFTVTVERSSHAMTFPSTEALWRDLRASHVGFALLTKTLPPAELEKLNATLHERLVGSLGEGPQEVALEAWLGLGRKG
ncbi:MAG: class I SAM-dependent methyltransferase [Sandaracinaceae bacterium]